MSIHHLERDSDTERGKERANDIKTERKGKEGRKQAKKELEQRKP